MRDIRERIDDIRNDRVNGASTLTRQALETLQLAAASLPPSPPERYLAALTEVAQELSRGRSNMHSIIYYMQCFLSEITQGPINNDLPLSTVQLVDNLLRRWEESRSQLIEAGAALIGEGQTIFTGSYSSTIIASLVAARRQGKDFKLLIALSRCHDDQPAYGQSMARELADQAVSGTLIEDTDIAEHLAKADMVLLGADTVLADNSVVNGYPSAVLARLARAYSVPVYILCEVSKCSGQTAVNLEPGFDLIPAELITDVITA